jgi:hypothetical protein
MSTTNLLDSIAVARRSEDEAATILQAYIATAPQMAQTYTPAAAPTMDQAPRSGGSSPQQPGGMNAGKGQKALPGGAGEHMQPQGVVVENANFTVSEHEVFKNVRNALAFFFYRHPVLDGNAEEGPFWFTIQDQRIIAGTSEAYAVFENIAPDVLGAAKQRGVIMLVEFENQQPYRCTPCYLSTGF